MKTCLALLVENSESAEAAGIVLACMAVAEEADHIVAVGTVQTAATASLLAAAASLAETRQIAGSAVVVRRRAGFVVVLVIHKIS